MPATMTPLPSRSADASGFRIEVAGSPEDIESTWREFERHAVGHVFQTFVWMQSWCRTVGAAYGIVPRILTGRDAAGRTSFILPMGIRKAFGARVAGWLGGKQADYHGGLFERHTLERLANEPAAFSTFLAGVLAALGEIDLLHLVRQPAVLQGVANPFLALPSWLNANSAHATVLEPDWETFYRARRPSGWRRTDRKKEQALAARGPVAFVVADSTESTDRLLTTLMEQKRQGLAQLGVPDMFAPEATAAFYRDLARSSCAAGPVELSALTAGGDIAAVSYGLRHRGIYYYVLHSYDSARLADLSPGRQLMYRLMQREFEAGTRVFDFTIGDEGYKDQWCEITTALWDSELAMTAQGAVLARGYRLAEAGKRRIKTDPVLWQKAVAVRRAWLGLRGSRQPRRAA